jgi:hypothetical protein
MQQSLTDVDKDRPVAVLNDTVDAERHLKLLEDHFVASFQGMGVSMGKTFFQQDGARTHMSNTVLSFLSEHFHDRVIINRYPERFGTVFWTQYSPDLNPRDYRYFLWGFLKDSVYRNNPHSVKEVKGEITILRRASLKKYWLQLWKISVDVSK